MRYSVKQKKGRLRISMKGHGTRHGYSAARRRNSSRQIFSFVHGTDTVTVRALRVCFDHIHTKTVSKLF